MEDPRYPYTDDVYHVIPEPKLTDSPSVYERLYDGAGERFPALEEISQFFETLWSYWKFFAFFLSIFLLAWIIYSLKRYNTLRDEQKEKLKSLNIDIKRQGARAQNERWQKVLEHAYANSQEEWRLAILEADIMLDEMMRAMGYTQDTLGEKLKSVEKSDFTTIDKAWEAHKVRNQIAHKGSEFVISEREVRRIIELYKEVFEEFKYI